MKFKKLNKKSLSSPISTLEKKKKEKENFHSL